MALLTGEWIDDVYRKIHATLTGDKGEPDEDLNGSPDEEEKTIKPCPNSVWSETEYEELGCALWEMKDLLGNNIAYFSGIDEVEMTRVLALIATEWALLEEGCLSVARAASRHDADPTMPGNGYRSLLSIMLAAVYKTIPRLKDCCRQRESLLFNKNVHITDLDDYGQILSLLRKMVQYAVMADSISCRNHLFLPESEAELEKQSIQQFGEFDCSCFYGRRAAFYCDPKIRAALSVIITAMAGYDAGFHSSANTDQQQQHQQEDEVIEEDDDDDTELPVQQQPTEVDIQIKTTKDGAKAVMKGVGYWINPKSRAESLIKRFRSCDIPFAKGFWGLTESAPLAQHTGSLISPWMAVNRDIKIPITEEDILTCFDDGPFGPLLAEAVSSPLDQLPSVERRVSAAIDKDLLSEIEIKQFNQIISKRKGICTTVTPLDTPLREFTKLVLKSVGDPFPFVDSGLGYVQAQLLNHNGDTQTTPRTPGIIIHFHGGGFVAQSPKSHEIYLRRWTKELGVPIISVDYSLAPEAWFPRAVQECFFVYKWVIANRAALGAGPKGRIILTGDSAGGNLAVGVALKSVISGIRKPDEVVVSYPVLNVKLAASPSRLMAMLDALLPMGLLECCLKAYTGNRPSSEYSPLMSPLIASDDLLKQFPPIRIVASEFDPLLDDSVVFIRKLRSMGLDATIDIAPKMPHGFLNLAYLGGGTDSISAVGLVVNHLSKALQGNTSNDDVDIIDPPSVLTAGGSVVSTNSGWFAP